MPKSVLLAPLLLLAAAPALAGDAPGLDLGLPQQPMFSGDSTSPYRDDPPGAYYGDTSGDPAPEPRIESACPTAPDGSERALTGSVTTGVGWSSHGGNSHYDAANLNFCKGFTDDDGNVRTMNFNLDIERYDGPGGYGRYGRYRGW